MPFFVATLKNKSNPPTKKNTLVLLAGHASGAIFSDRTVSRKRLSELISKKYDYYFFSSFPYFDSCVYSDAQLLRDSSGRLSIEEKKQEG